MKLKRTKLAALAMSALMAVSAFSPYVYAEEEEDVAAAAVEETTEVATEETAEEVDIPSEATVSVVSSVDIEVEYNTDQQSIKNIVVTAKDENGYTIDTDQFTATGSDSEASWTVTFSAPTCTAAGSLKVEYKRAGGTTATTTTYTYEDKGKDTITVTNASSDKEGKASELTALGHVEKTDTSSYRYIDANHQELADATTCVADGFLQYEVVCSRCGIHLGWDEENTTVVHPAGHTYDDSTTRTLVTWKGTSDGYDNADNLANIETGSKVSASKGDVVDADGMKLGSFDGLVTLYKTVNDSNGVPTLVDTAQDGYYYVKYTCTTCGETVYELCHVNATASAYAKIILSGTYKPSNVTAFYIDGDRYTLSDLADENNYYYVDNNKVQINTFSTSLTSGTTEYQQLPDDEDVELTDCTKTGYYWIQFYNESGVETARKKVEVSAHHMEVQVAVFESQEDMEMCNVTTNADGSLSVVSKSCYIPVYYTLVTECKAVNCPNAVCQHTYEMASGSKILNGIKNGEQDYDCVYHVVEVVATNVKAEAEGAHTYLKEAENALKKLIEYAEDENINLTTEYIQAWLTDSSKGYTHAISADGFAYKDYVKVLTDTDTSTCTTTGQVTIAFYCTSEPSGNTTVVKTMTVNVGAKGHKDAGVTVEDYNEADCENPGSYTRVHKCERCDYRYEDDVKVTTPRKAHTNEIAEEYNSTAEEYTDDTTNKNNASTVYIQFVGDRVVDTGSSLLNAFNAGDTTFTRSGTYLIGGTSENDSTLGVLARVYTNCTTCGNHEVELSSDTMGEGKLTVTIDDIKAQDGNGAGGYIILTATFTSKTATVSPASITGTFNYYTSATAYNGRVDKDTAYDPDVTTKNGIYEEDGIYKYYVSNEWAETFSGIIEYNGGNYFVANGVLCTSANGLNLYDGTWYMLANGMIQTQYTDVAIYDGEVFYVTAGQLDTSVTGLVEYDGAKFLFCYGRLMSEVSGLWFYDSAIGGDDSFYYLVAGQVANYSGPVIYDNTFFLVENGKLSTYTGTYDYDGATFNVENGQFISQVA
ncbi:MAG: hypothetical protein LUH00_00215 [Lachnospiraceae bacterium]|nr:hypothetical protein [Lachnospiraceae bacterium]